MRLFIFFYAAYLTRVLCLRDLEMFRSQPLRSYSIYSHSPERVKWKWFVAPYVWYRKSQFVVEFWRLKNSKRSDGPKKDFDDPVGQFVVEFWRLKSRKKIWRPLTSYGWDYDANRGESMPIMLWRCSEHLVRSSMVGNVCHLLYDLLYVGNVCHLLYEYWRNLQRQFVLTLLNNQYSIVHPRFVFFRDFIGSWSFPRPSKRIFHSMQ